MKFPMLYIVIRNILPPNNERFYLQVRLEKQQSSYEYTNACNLANVNKANRKKTLGKKADRIKDDTQITENNPELFRKKNNHMTCMDHLKINYYP